MFLEEISSNGSCYEFNIERELSFILLENEWSQILQKNLGKAGQIWYKAAHVKGVVPSCSINFTHLYSTTKKTFRYSNYFKARTHCKVAGCVIPNWLLSGRRKQIKSLECKGSESSSKRCKTQNTDTGRGKEKDTPCYGLKETQWAILW